MCCVQFHLYPDDSLQQAAEEDKCITANGELWLLEIHTPSARESMTLRSGSSTQSLDPPSVRESESEPKDNEVAADDTFWYEWYKVFEYTVTQ